MRRCPQPRFSSGLRRHTCRFSLRDDCLAFVRKPHEVRCGSAHNSAHRNARGSDGEGHADKARPHCGRAWESPGRPAQRYSSRFTSGGRHDRRPCPRGRRGRVGRGAATPRGGQNRRDPRGEQENRRPGWTAFPWGSDLPVEWGAEFIHHSAAVDKLWPRRRWRRSRAIWRQEAKVCRYVYHGRPISSAKQTRNMAIAINGRWDVVSGRAKSGSVMADGAGDWHPRERSVLESEVRAEYAA